jgi:hypothetical protein
VSLDRLELAPARRALAAFRTAAATDADARAREVEAAFARLATGDGE